MSYAVVTIEIDPKTKVDLALPLNIPSQVLADAIIKALNVGETAKHYSLAVRNEEGLARLPSQTSLGDAGVLDGYVLQVLGEKQAPSTRKTKSHAYLESDTGKTFMLTSDNMLIGRKDVKRGVVVDIDLAPLDSRKIVSRKHAIIELQNGKWMLVDQKSVNGTWLNGHKLTAEESYPLQEGDEIIFGRNGVILKFLASM